MTTEPAANADSQSPITLGDRRYAKVPFEAPRVGALYSVRDKSTGERFIIVTALDSDGERIEVQTIDDGEPSNRTFELSIESLARQAEKGWCTSLQPVDDASDQLQSSDDTAAAEDVVTNEDATCEDSPANVMLRIDIQNFGRCCADIVRANIKFSTQLIKDVGDGPFRAGNYEQAFLTFEQIAVGFNAAVAASRRTIADGRRALASQKFNLSGKEIQERTAAFVRSEQLIQTAEREFASILEGLRMYLRATQEPIDT
jgi:hypothetical protein